MAGQARLSVGVSTDAREASAEFKALAADVKSVGDVSNGVNDGMQRVDAALQKLANARDTPMAIARAVAKLKVETEDLRAELERTPASAERMKAIEAALARADAAMTNSIARAGKLKESQEEVAQKMGLTAKGAEALGSSFGSLQGILGKMADQSSSASQAIAKVGFSVLAVGEALQFGYESGTKFNQFLEQHGNYLAKAIDGTVNFLTGLRSEDELLQKLPTTMNTALRAKQQLSEEMGKTLAGLKSEMGGWQDLEALRKKTIEQATLISERYVQLKSSGKDWRTEMEMQAPAINATAEMAMKLGMNIADLPLGFRMASDHSAEFAGKLAAVEREARLTGDGVRGLRDTLESLPQNLGEFRLPEVIDGLSKAIQSAAREGKDWSVILSDYRRELALLQAECEKAGVQGVDLFRVKILSLIPAHEAAKVALGSHAKEIDGWLDGMSAGWRKLEADAKRAREAEAAANNRTSQAPAEFRQIQDAAFGAAVAAGELGTNLDRVAEAVVATGGQMVVGAPIMFQMARATDEAVAATLRLVDATKRLREEQFQTLEVTRGWLDYVTNLREGYESGQNSLISYISALQDFATQLRTLFAGATGEAAESIQNMIDLINTLIATAGANAPTTSGNRQLDELNRLLDKGR